ncbi:MULTISPECIES: NAD(P)/FAD-dependent oxidoreductase [Rhodococcus]|nr:MULTISPECIES: FAD-dependent oxidoreductase [Rhodococcus]
MTGSFDSVAVVGGGMAGATAVTALRDQGFSGRVCLIGAEEHLPYERPPLSKEFLGGEMPEDRLLVHSRETYEEQDIELLLGRRAIRLCPADGAVELEGGERVGADRVLLCMGVRPRPVGVPGGTLPGVHYLHDLEDAWALQTVIERGVPVVVVGEGFIGSEVASTLAEQGADVTLLMAGDLPMPVLGAEASGWILDQHRSNGVDVRARSPLQAIRGRDRVESVELSDGTVLPAGAVVVGIGSEPVVDLATDVGITVDNGILVDGLSRTSVPGIYAAGDLARFPSPTFGRSIRVEHWQNAQLQAAKAVEGMLGHGDRDIEPYDDIPWAWTKQYGNQWEIAGRPGPDMQVIRRGVPGSTDGALWIFSAHGRVQGAVVVNRRRELRAVRRALEQGPIFTNDTIRDESVDLRAALSDTDAARHEKTA